VALTGTEVLEKNPSFLREASISCLDTSDRKLLFPRGRRLCHICGSDYWRAEEHKMEASQEMETYFIEGHGPFVGVQGSVPLGDSGMPEACADDAPLENACPTCQTQANLRRWTG
jgi:hypothetical protein